MVHGISYSTQSLSLGVRPISARLLSLFFRVQSSFAGPPAAIRLELVGVEVRPDNGRISARFDRNPIAIGPDSNAGSSVLRFRSQFDRNPAELWY